MFALARQKNESQPETAGSEEVAEETNPDPAPVIVYGELTFEPQCDEQWEPECISIALELPDEIHLRGLRQGSRVWHIKNGAFHPVRLPSHNMLSGKFEVLVKRDVHNPEPVSSAPGVAASNRAKPAGPLDQPPVPSSLPKPDEIAEIPRPGKKRDIVVTRAQLTQHWSLPSEERIPTACFGIVRLAVIKSAVKAVLTPTTEAFSRKSIHNQDQPGIAAESVYCGLTTMFSGWQDLNLPFESKKVKLGDDKENQPSTERPSVVSRELVGKAISQVFMESQAKARSSQKPSIVKKKSCIKFPEGQNACDYANEHNITLNQDLRVKAYHGLRWYNPDDQEDKAAVEENLKKNMLAWWMVRDMNISKLLATLSDISKNRTVFTETYKGTLAKKNENIKRVLTHRNADLSLSKKRRISHNLPYQPPSLPPQPSTPPSPPPSPPPSTSNGDNLLEDDSPSQDGISDIGDSPATNSDEGNSPPSRGCAIASEAAHLAAPELGRVSLSPTIIPSERSSSPCNVTPSGRTTGNHAPTSTRTHGEDNSGARSGDNADLSGLFSASPASLQNKPFPSSQPQGTEGDHTSNIENAAQDAAPTDPDDTDELWRFH